MRSSGVRTAASRATSARIQRSVTPWERAARLARWMVTPSAMGSVNGTAISTASGAAASKRHADLDAVGRGGQALEVRAELLAPREACRQVGDERGLTARGGGAD